jgi:predicted membrane channel-forming protein YqfA (hemolysin III family)
MAREGLGRREKWLLAVLSLTAGVVGVLAAFGLVRGGGEIDLLWLAVGLVNLVASGAWFLNLRAS